MCATNPHMETWDWDGLERGRRGLCHAAVERNEE